MRLAHAFVASLLLSAGAMAQIAWQKTLESALATAKDGGKVVFLAVNMDGEKANDRMATKMYAEKEVVALAARTINVVASAAEHAAPTKACTRFDGLLCLDHRRVDMEARKDVLKGDASGMVIAPQHVWLSGDGKVLLSVPYEIAKDEMVWCFVTAIKKLDPKSDLAMPSTARAPRRVVMDGVFDPGAAETAAPLSKKELAELIEKVKRGVPAEERWVAIQRILVCDDPIAVDYIQSELRSGTSGGGRGGGGGGGGGRGGGGGGGGGGAARGAADGAAKHMRIIRAIGAGSPPVYAPLVHEFVGNFAPEMRSEAAVALEQLATPDSTKVIEKQLAEEKDPKVQKDLVRALAACGAKEAKVKKDVARRARSEKDLLVRRNAIYSLSQFAPDKDVLAVLDAVLTAGSEEDKRAAALALSVKRDEGWRGALEAHLRSAADGPLKTTLEAALAVSNGADLSTIGAEVARLCGDEIERVRIFGSPAARGNGGQGRGRGEAPPAGEPKGEGPPEGQPAGKGDDQDGEPKQGGA